jgi:hypothetical protein
MIAYFPKRYTKPFPITAGQTQMVKINIRSFSQTVEKFLVNCVDINTNQMVHSWMIKVKTTAPNITQVKKVNCKIGEDSV